MYRIAPKHLKERNVGVSRKCTTEVRWRGEAVTELAVLEVLRYSGMDVAPGLYERWMSVPCDQVDQVKRVIEQFGGEVIERQLGSNHLGK